MLYRLLVNCKIDAPVFVLLFISVSPSVGRQPSTFTLSSQHLQGSGLALPHRTFQWRPHSHCIQIGLGTQRTQQGIDINAFWRCVSWQWMFCYGYIVPLGVCHHIKNTQVGCSSELLIVVQCHIWTMIDLMGSVSFNFDNKQLSVV